MQQHFPAEPSEDGTESGPCAGEPSDLACALARLAPRYGFNRPIVVIGGPGTPASLVAIVTVVEEGTDIEASDVRARKLLDEARKSISRGQAAPDYRFTRAEKAVLIWLRLGRTNRDIGQILHKSEYTVKTHIQHMLAKTGLDNRLQLAALAAE